MRPADAAELAAWDARVVDGPGGHVYQSLAWARHRARFGWTPRHLMLDDGFPVLALTRPWRLVPGGSAYISRGPAPADDPGTTASRLLAVATWLGEHDVDVVAADPEVPTSSDFVQRIRLGGFRGIEELQPSRHRMDVALPASGDEAALLASFAVTTRQRIRQAERQGLRVLRLDRRAAEGDTVLDVSEQAGRLARLYAILDETARRRQFWLADRPTFMSWTNELLESGHGLCLYADSEDGETVAAASFYRHGDRLTFALSGELAAARRTYPGAMRLLLWEAMRLALREGRATMDLGGVDVRGARRRPRPDEPEHGMLTFKESFGAVWVDLAGAHERVIRPARYALGRLAARLGGGR